MAILLEPDTYAVELDLSSLANGTYLMGIENNGSYSPWNKMVIVK